ncbi:MAG: hypothetical protein J2P20_11165 [Pseudonocardia sp.]|nr:hypothetical protein [Pseudonocardia sp.]
MTTTETTSGVEPLAAYPAQPYTSHYGVSVWLLGEDGDQGWMIAGHGRRAYAALKREARECAPLWGHSRAHRDGIERLWVLFHDRCGHTEAEHATHLAEDMDDCGCDWDGLPPCEPDRYAWRYVAVSEGTDGALPVLRVDL